MSATPPDSDLRRMWQAAAAYDWNDEPSIPESLPLLDELRERIPDADLSSHTVILIQHQMATTPPAVQAMVSAGMEPANAWFVDIPYSTSEEVHRRLLESGLMLEDHCLPSFTDPFADYSFAQTVRVANIIQRVLEAGPVRQLLVVDDGAYFARAVLSMSSAGWRGLDALEGAAVIEQTTRGHRYLLKHQKELLARGFRMVSAARAFTKQNFESHFVGASVASVIRKQCSDVASDGHLAVLGHGVVGRACVDQLRMSFPNADISVVESRTPDPGERRDGITWHRTLEGLQALDLVLGCTGVTAFTLADRVRLASRAILASGSSAAVEFDRFAFVELADSLPDDQIEVLERPVTQEAGIHADIHIQHETGVATFLNAGFPINFDGRRESLPMHMIQPTRCLMHAAAVEALRCDSPVLKELDGDTDHWLYQRALDYLPDAS